MQIRLQRVFGYHIRRVVEKSKCEDKVMQAVKRTETFNVWTQTRKFYEMIWRDFWNFNEHKKSFNTMTTSWKMTPLKST